MKRTVPLLIILIALILCPHALASAQGEWKTIKTFMGSGGKDTEDFTVPVNYWRITYTIKTESNYPGFSASIYPKGETALYIAHVDLDKAGTDTSYIRAGPGDFWIHVGAANLDSWMIEVQTQQ